MTPPKERFLYVDETGITCCNACGCQDGECTCITHDPAAVDSPEMVEYHIHAEHCPGPFYMGWHLYMDEVIDGIPIANNNHQWLKHDYGMPRTLMGIAQAYSIIIPKPERYTDKCAKSVGLQRPQGFRVYLSKDRPQLENFLITPELLEREMERTSRWRYADDDYWQSMPLVEMVVIDSEPMLIWCHELDKATTWLVKASQVHRNSACTDCDCVAQLRRHFADIDLTEAEARALLLTFADIMATPSATVIAGLWAGYFAQGGV